VRETFPWAQTADRLSACLRRVRLELAESGREFRGRGVRFSPPLVLPIRGRDAARYLAELDGGPRRQIILLLRAGVAALGYWRADALLQHKVVKKYVVRGRGRAQPSYLRSKGKSRHGSRLRLRNARALLQEVNGRLEHWWRQEGPAEVFYSCGVRLWADLRQAPVAPPFAAGEALKLPLDVRAPSHVELLRVRRLMSRGSVEWLDGG